MATLPPALPQALRTHPPSKGDTVVHLDHGLCRLGPVRRMELTDTVVETVELRFRGGETLAVPLTDAVRIWNYGASVPKKSLDRLGADDWAQRQAERVVELRASLDTLLERRRARDVRSDAGLAAKARDVKSAGKGFPHTLTDDQTKALDEVVADLRAPRPMDRLLIGDVGCGKTEVAVRAALAAAMGGAKVRIVAPTRVLARQHHVDIAERAEAVGLATALYSGDVAEGRLSEVRDGLDDLDIVVGTQGALDLDGFALTILDEEQKFGAEAKQVAGNLLRLSATPIPRTLAEAKVGLADVSLIETYPKGRGATETLFMDDDNRKIRDMIAGELEQGGQVLLLCARIRDLKRLRKRIAKLFPDASIARVHGQRKAKGNRKALDAFRRGEADILLATSMLETGVNVPGANLMLVFTPHRFGLGQLHQLRGRVGRGTKDARFVLVRGKKGTKAFRRRVRALEQMDARGDGLALACADATLRGSGSFADDEQSGHASELGLELYEHLLDVAARDGATRDGILRAVPQIHGQWDWNIHGDWSRAVAQSRDALANPLHCLRAGACQPYPTLICAALALGATRAGVGPKAVALELADGETLTLEPDMDAVAEAAADALGRGAKTAA